MKLDLNSVDFVPEESGGLHFRKVTKKDGLNYKRNILDVLAGELGEYALNEIVKDPLLLYISWEKTIKS